MQEICLKVKNIQELGNYTSAHHIFGQNGGSIGSGADNVWILDDKNNQIKNIQVILSYEEGVYGLKPYDKDCQVFLNDSFSPISYSYETAIRIGDYFRIGELEIEVIAPEELHNSENKAQEITDLGNLNPYIEPDESTLPTKGVEINAPLIEDETINLFDEEEDILGLREVRAESTGENSSIIPDVDYFASYANIQKMISERVAKLKKHTPSKHPLEINKDKFRMLDLQSRIEHFLLIDNKELLNLIVLSLLCESLQNPLLQTLHPDYFEKALSEIIESAVMGEGGMIESALLEILNQRSKTEDH